MTGIRSCNGRIRSFASVVMIVRHIGPRGKRRSIPASERKWAAILQADVVHKSCVLSALAVERLPAPPPDVSNEVLSLWNKSEADALIAEAAA